MRRNKKLELFESLIEAQCFLTADTMTHFDKNRAKDRIYKSIDILRRDLKGMKERK